MLIGNIDSFAVEYELDKNHGGEWLFGKICYWINGDRIGAYELGTSLRDVLFQMKYILQYCGNRVGESLCEIEARRCFSIIDNALYGGDDEENAHENFLRYDVRIPVDVFDFWKIYLIECKGVASLIYKNLEQGGVRCCSLPLGRFDQVIKDFYSHLEADYKHEVTS